MEVVIGFYRGTSFKAKLIKFWTKSEYSHCEILFDGFSYNADTEMGLLRYNLEKYNEKEWDSIKIFVDVSSINKKKIEKFIQAQLGLQYDWKGIILSQFFRFGINSDDKWFCSEFVTKVLQLFMVEETLDVQPNKVSPEKLFQILNKP